MIDLKDYIKVLKNNIVLIIIITLVFAVLGFIYAKITPTKYVSSTQIYTNDAPDLTGYLQTNYAINRAYKYFKGQTKYTTSQLSEFRANVRSIQVSNNIVSLQITTTNQDLSNEWVMAYQKSIYNGSTRKYLQKIINGEYKDCVKSQKQALDIDKSNKKLTIVPTCIRTYFVKYNPSQITNSEILPSKTLDLILFGLSGFLLSIVIVSYREYKK